MQVRHLCRKVWGRSAFELCWALHRSGSACRVKSQPYYNGEGVERDEKKKYHYYELAAMGGVVEARYNLGSSEARAGNWDRAIKHFMIAVGDGYSGSVKRIQQLYKSGHATRDDYSNALRAYQAYLEEVRSEQRDKAAAYNDQFKYFV